MAIAIDASSPAIVSNTSTAKTTASFTAPANSVIVACVGLENTATVTITNSGTALTWSSRIVRKGGDSGAEDGYAAIFTAPAPTSAARTVTATSSVSNNAGGLKVLVATGADLASPVGATGSGSSTTGTINPNVYTSTFANSRGICVANDWSAAGSPSSSDTEFPYDVGGTSGMAIHKAADTAVSGSSVAMNIVGAGGGTAAWNWAAIELKPGSTLQTVTPGSIASSEAFGTTQLNLTVAPTAIASAEAFGSLIITTPQTQTITPTGIASDQAFGNTTLGLFLKPSAIASGEAFGTHAVRAVIGPIGIASGEAFGSTNVAGEQFISPTGIFSRQAFGSTKLWLGIPQTVVVSGIASQERVSEPLIKLLHRRMLRNPSIQEAPAALSRPFNRFGIHRGISIIKRLDGSYYSARYPAQTELEEAEAFYLGGRFHPVSNEVADELIVAGYGAYLVLVEND